MILKNPVTVDDNDDAKLQTKSNSITCLCHLQWIQPKKRHRKRRGGNICSIAVTADLSYQGIISTVTSVVLLKKVRCRNQSMNRINQLDKKGKTITFSEKRNLLCQTASKRKNNPKHMKNKKTRKTPAARRHKTRKNIAKKQKDSFKKSHKKV